MKFSIFNFQFSILIILLGFLLLPLVSLATHGGAPLVPCGNPGQPACQLCHFFVLFQNTVNYLLIHIVPVVAVLMLVIGGFMYAFAYFEMIPKGATGGPALISRAKALFTYTIVGLIVIYASWLIINLFFQVIGVADWTGLKEGWWQFKCEITNAAPPINPPPQTPPTTPTTTPPTTPPSQGTLTHEQALAQLQAAGIGISSSGNCSDQNRPECTSLEGIQQETINRIITFKNDCNCEVIITGGTETGHERGPYSHGTGYKVDIRATKEVDNYIYTNPEDYTYLGLRASDGARLYKDSIGTIYARETNHWDIGWKPFGI